MARKQKIKSDVVRNLGYHLSGKMGGKVGFGFGSYLKGGVARLQSRHLA